MSKCIRCGTDWHGKICPTCMSNWSDMRTAIFEVLTNKYGKVSQENHPLFIKHTKRLESIWRKDKAAFIIELDKINNEGEK